MLEGEFVTRATARANRRIDIPLPNPQRWAPDSPTLYDLKIQLVAISDPLPQPENGQQLTRATSQQGATEQQIYQAADTTNAKVLDSVTSYVGLRNIRRGLHPEQGHPCLLLNGKPIFHLGPLDQGWWPDGLYTPPSDEAWVHELTYLKAAGFNALRKHIKIEAARYYYHCDKIGILVWQDMPSGFLPAQFIAPNDEGEGVRSSQSTQTFELELQRMLHQLAHFPSIVMWVLHNEGWGQFATQQLTHRIKGIDPTRLVNATSGWLDMRVGDVIDTHDYDEQPTAPTGDGQRALVLGEYGGIGWPVPGHQWNPDMRNWGYQTFHSADEVRAAYQKVNQAIINMAQQHGLCGAIYTQTTDVEGEVNGLLTYDRRVEKLPSAWLHKQHLPLHQAITPQQAD